MLSRDAARYLTYSLGRKHQMRIVSTTVRNKGTLHTPSLAVLMAWCFDTVETGASDAISYCAFCPN